MRPSPAASTAFGSSWLPATTGAAWAAAGGVFTATSRRLPQNAQNFAAAKYFFPHCVQNAASSIGVDAVCVTACPTAPSCDGLRIDKLPEAGVGAPDAAAPEDGCLEAPTFPVHRKASTTTPEVGLWCAELIVLTDFTNASAPPCVTATSVVAEAAVGGGGGTLRL